MENIFVISESSWEFDYSHYQHVFWKKYLAYLILKTVSSYVKLIHHIFNELFKFMNIKSNLIFVSISVNMSFHIVQWLSHWNVRLALYVQYIVLVCRWRALRRPTTCFDPVNIICRCLFHKSQDLASV